MNIMRRGTVMRNGGCALQQEDWSKDYPSIHKQGDQLAAYPVASVSGGPYDRYRRGRSFRLGMYFPSGEAAAAAFAGTGNCQAAGLCRVLRHCSWRKQKRRPGIPVISSTNQKRLPFARGRPLLTIRLF